MRKPIYLVVSAFSMYALTTAALCGEPQLSFFESFKAICVDTGGQRDSVEKAIERAGGRLRESRYDGVYVSFRSWDVTAGGHPMYVQFTMVHKGNPNGVICGVTSERNEDDSISAIIKWVGVAPETDTENSKFQHTNLKFRYQQQGDRRSPWPANQAVIGQMAKNGQLHTLWLSHDSTGGNVSIHWDVPVRESPRP